MATVAYIDAHLDLNTGQFTGAVNSAGVSLRGFSTNVNGANGHISKFHGSLMSTVVVLGQLRAAMHTVWAISGQWVGAIIEANSKLEKMQVLMKGLSSASTDAGKTTDALRDMNYVLGKSKAAPFSIEEISNAFIKLKASGIDPTKGGLDALMDGIAKFGGDDQTFHRATVAIQQMAGKGVISMEELRQQLGEAMPNAMNLLARATKMSMAQLVKVISTGKLEAKSALSKLFLEMQFDSRGAASRMMETWTGLISRLKTEWLTFAKDIGGNGLFDNAKQSLRDLIAFMGSSAGKKFAGDLGAGLRDALTMVTRFIGYLVAHRETIVSFGRLIAIAFAAKWAGGFIAAILNVGAAILGLNAKMGAFINTVTTAWGSTNRYGATLSALAGPIGIAMALVVGLTLKIMDQERQARAAAQAWVDYGKAITNGYVTQDQIDKAKELTGLRAEARKLVDGAQGKNWDGAYNTQLSNLVEKMHAAGFLDKGSDMTTFQERVDMLKNAMPRLAEEMKKVHAGLKLFDSQQAQAEVDGYLDKTTKAIERRVPDIGNTLTKISSEIANHVVPQKEGDSKMEAVRLDYVRRMTMEWTAERDNLNKLIESTPTTNKNYDILVAKQKLANQKLLEIQEQRKTILSDNTMNTSAAKTPAEKKAEKKAEDLVTFYETLQGKIAGLNAQLVDGNTKLSTFDELVSLGKYGSKNALVDKTRAALVELAKLTKEAKDKKAIETIGSGLDDAGAAADADVLSNALRLQTGEWDNAAKGVISFNREVEVMRLHMRAAGATKGEMAAFEAQAAKIADTLRKVDLQNFNQQTKDDKWQLYLDKLPQKARAQAEFNKKLLQYADIRKSLLNSDGSNAAEVDAGIEARKKLDMEQFNFDNRSGLQQWIDQWSDTTDEMSQLWNNSMDNIAQSLTDMIMTGKIGFKDLARSILAEITKILVSKAVAQLASVIMNMFGSSSSGSTGSSFIGNSSYVGAGSAYAMGGVHGPSGSMPLHTYSMGGVANTPQMAIFGEGRKPEAYVPLPDGRNIPVKMEGAGGGVQCQANINVTINQDGDAKSDTSGDGARGRELARQLDIKVKDTLINEMRPGGILWKSKMGA